MNTKNKIIRWISIIYILTTGGFNLIGYFNLPDIIATQFSFSGEQVNHMPTPIYLIASFLLVTILSVVCITRQELQQKIKYLLVNTIILIANIVMIATQL